MNSNGAEKLKISELAKKANVTKRTIDYYTHIGLLTPKRSDSNYRYYDESAVEQLQFIAKLKKDHLTLEEIKSLLQGGEAEKVDIRLLNAKMQSLEQELLNQLSLLKNSSEAEKITVKRQLSERGQCLIKALKPLIK